VIKNRDLYKSNCEIRVINTRHGIDLHPSTSRLTTFQKRASYLGIKFSNHLPPSIENFSREKKQYRLALKEVSSHEFIL